MTTTKNKQSLTRRIAKIFSSKEKTERGIASLVALLITFSLPLGLSLVTNQETTKSMDSPYSSCGAVKVIAHRGAVSKSHTENTLRAFDLAISQGATMVETDLRLSKDRRWVLMHDSKLNRTTNGTGDVSKRPWSYIKKLRTNDRVKGGVPTIQDVITRYKKKATLTFDLEIKEKNPPKAKLLGIMHYLKKQGVKDRVLFTSFSSKTISMIRSIDSSWQTALITGKPITPATAAAYGNIVVVHQKLVNKEFVDAMRNAGVVVYPWGVDDETIWKKVVGSGVAGIITDRVPMAKRTCVIEASQQQ